MTPPSPTLEQVADQLRALLGGRLGRSEASAWAGQWLGADDPAVDDDVVWSALGGLGMADLRGWETEFLYHDADFQSWLDEVETAIAARS